MRHALLLLLVAAAASAQPATQNCRSSASNCSVAALFDGSDLLFRTGTSSTNTLGDTTLNCVNWGPSTGGNQWWMCGKPNVSLTIFNNSSAYTHWRLSDGFLVADNGVESPQLKSTRASGSDAFYVTTNGARWHFGAGASDYASSDGTTVTFAGPLAGASTIASAANVAGAIKVTGTGSIGVAGATDATIDALSGATGTYHYNSDTDRPEFATSTRWNQLGGAVQWALERRTLAVNPFLAESTLCPRCTECHGTTLTAMDGQTCTDSAAGTTSTVNNIDFRNFNTTAVANNVSGWITRVSETRLNQGPHAVFIVYVAAITLERVWYGLSSAVLSGADLPAASLAAFRFSTAAADTTWMACTGNGTTTACTTVGSAVSANQAYRLEVDCRPSASCIFKVEKVGTAGTNRVAVSTNLPVASTGMSVRHYCETLTTAAKTCGFGPAALETL